jgi:hypothetical protein
MQQSINKASAAMAARSICGAAFLAMLAASACAAPAEPVVGQPAAKQEPRPEAPASAKAGIALDFGPVAETAKLEQSRGGAAEPKSEMNLDGAVTGNSAVNVTTGNNVIDAGSFANMSGIPIVIQNSGANVLIQNATIINLQFK